MSIDNPYASPNPDPLPTMGRSDQVHAASSGPWRRRSSVVAARGIAFPHRCVKCNQPTGGQTLRRRLAWHPGWVFLLILAGLLFYVIVALIVRKSMTVRVGLCPMHFKRRRIIMAIGWFCVVSSIGVPILLGIFTRTDPGALWLFGAGATLFSAIVSLLAVRVVTPWKIEDDFAWIRGTSMAFRESLPERPGR